MGDREARGSKRQKQASKLKRSLAFQMRGSVIMQNCDLTKSLPTYVCPPHSEDYLSPIPPSTTAWKMAAGDRIAFR